MKRTPPPLSLVLAALINVTASLQGQISVGPSGYPANPFTNTPPASEWATLDITVVSSSTYASPAALDAAAQTFDQSTITTPLPLTSANGTSRLARHNTTGTYLVTQPTGVPAAVLKATLRNTSGSGIGSIIVSYDYTIPVAPGTDECTGQRVFYSLSGTPNSWILIPEFSGITTAGSLSATLSLGFWTNNTDMYILVLDDNNLTGADGAFAIDNFAIGNVLGINECVAIVAESGSISVVEHGLALFSLTATGTPQSIQWYRSDDGGANYAAIPGATTSSYSIPSVVYPGNNGDKFYATVSNSTCNVISTVKSLSEKG